MGMGAGETAAGDGASADGLVQCSGAPAAASHSLALRVGLARDLRQSAGLAIGLATMIVLLPIMKLRDLRHRPWMA